MWRRPFRLPKATVDAPKLARDGGASEGWQACEEMLKPFPTDVYEIDLAEP